MLLELQNEDKIMVKKSHKFNLFIHIIKFTIGNCLVTNTLS